MLLLGDCNDWLQETKDNSIDLIVTDPPYGIEFMGKDWDKALVGVETWKECYRVLKEGKLAFVMCSPRQDVLSRMIINLQDAGFRTNYTSIYWTYASGFPKAANVSKLIDKANGRTQETFKPFCEYLKRKRQEKGLSQTEMDKLLKTNTAYCWWETRLHSPTRYYYDQLKQILELDNRFDELIEREEAEREIIGTTNRIAVNAGSGVYRWNDKNSNSQKEIDITKPATEAAKAMEGAYVGFQPKPAVEVILVVSKGKTLSWLDDCRIPYQNEADKFESHEATGLAKDKFFYNGEQPIITKSPNEKGRFPANVACSTQIEYDLSELLELQEELKTCK